MCKADSVALSNALIKYKEMDPSFDGTRECQFLDDLAAKIEDNDVDGFTLVVAEFDKMSRLDNWKTTLLLRVKKRLNSAEQDEEDLC